MPPGTPVFDGRRLVALEAAEPLEVMPRQRAAETLPAPAPGPASAAALRALRALRPWRLLPDPAATPFTFVYAAVLVLTSLVAALADPALVHGLYQASSTDVAHLLRTPVL